MWKVKGATVRAVGVRFVSGLVASAVVLYGETAFAGCPSTCVIEASPAVVDPALACASFTVVEDTCGCGVKVDVSNGCPTSLEFSDTVFRRCGPESNSLSRDNCAMLGPGEVATNHEFLAEGDGHGVFVMTFTADGVEHRARIEAEVSDFDDSPGGCSFSGRVPRTSAWVHLLGFAAAWFVVRRKRVRPTVKTKNAASPSTRGV